ncbi:hypothetical protein B0H14DRAFT_3460351 [Mycena olivaceomarginata]|nr:hypothetical protein B0H14DRAFT_3460351 [Mycena olivaceomarginata]
MSELVGGNIEPEEREVALNFQPPLFHAEPPTSTTVIDPSSVTIHLLPPYPVKGCFVCFSSAQLAALKVQATDPNGTGWISTFDALSVYIYQHVHQAQLHLSAKDPNFGALSPTDFLTAVDLHCHLGLPARYFPNTLFTLYITIPPDVLATGPL